MVEVVEEGEQVAEIKVMDLARKHNIRPQKIFGLIRRGRISKVERDGKTFVDEDQCLRVCNITTRVARSKDGEAPVKSHAKRGDIMHWATNGSRPRRIVQVGSVGEYLTEGRDIGGKPVTRLNESLNKQIEKGITVIEKPEVLFEMIRRQWELAGETARAASLQAWLLAEGLLTFSEAEPAAEVEPGVVA